MKGRFTEAGKGVVRLTGKMSGKAFSREMPVRFESKRPEHEALATLWARAKVDDLMGQDWNGIQNGSPRPEIRQQITQLGLVYRLMTQFTSFVAVEETIVTEGGAPRRIEVPVEMPQGVDYEGVFGDRSPIQAKKVAFASRGFAGGALQANIAQEAVAPPPPVAPHGARVDQDASSDKASNRRQREAKLDAKLGAIVGQSGVKVAVEIWLSEATPEVLKQLEALGFELSEEPKVAKIRLGRIGADKLAALAALDAVRFVKAR
ncbi:MAG: hypothetical protein R2748_02485 [Bryobacterales bacterium]